MDSKILQSEPSFGKWPWLEQLLLCRTAALQNRAHKESALYATLDKHRETDTKKENRTKYLHLKWIEWIKLDISFHFIYSACLSLLPVSSPQHRFIEAKTSAGCAESFVTWLNWLNTLPLFQGLVMTWSLSGISKTSLLDILYDKCNTYPCKLKSHQRLSQCYFTTLKMHHICSFLLNLMSKKNYIKLMHSSFSNVPSLRKSPFISCSQTQVNLSRWLRWPGCHEKPARNQTGSMCVHLMSKSESCKSITKLNEKPMTERHAANVARAKRKESFSHCLAPFN